MTYLKLKIEAAGPQGISTVICPGKTYLGLDTPNKNII